MKRAFGPASSLVITWGQIVTELALPRPDLVSHAVLIGPVTDSARPSAIWHALTLGLDSLLERPLTNMAVAIDYLRCGLTWYLTELPVMLNYRLDQRLPLARQPVLVIRGTVDPIARRSGCARLANGARLGKFVEVPGQPHVAHRGGAAKVVTAILQLLAEHPFSPHARTRQTGPSRSSANMVAFGHARTVDRVPGISGHAEDGRDFRSVTVGDRQCRAYMIRHRGRTGAPVESGQRPVPVFVLIHGIGMSHRYFKRLAALLSEHGDTYLIRAARLRLDT